MKTSLLAKLELAMAKFIEANCEEDDWIDAGIPPDAERLMAIAAATVLDTMVAQEDYAKAIGMWKYDTNLNT